MTLHIDGQMDGETDAGNDNTQRPKLAWGKDWYEQCNAIITQLIFLKILTTDTP